MDPKVLLFILEYLNFAPTTMHHHLKNRQIKRTGLSAIREVLILSSKMKIAVIGASMATCAAIQSRMKDDIEIVAFADDEHINNVKLISEEIHQLMPCEFKPTWKLKHGKEGRNKSDRKRNRKNRWG